MMRLAERHRRQWPIAFALAVALSAAGGAAAQTDDGAAAAPDDAEAASAATESAEAAGTEAAEGWDAGSLVRQAIEEWKTHAPVGRSFQARYATGEITLVEGVALASFRTDEKRWGKSRSLAYTRAFVTAMNDYVSRIRTKTTSRLLRSHFVEDLDESEFVYRAGESSAEMVARVATKALTLAERRLDAALVETGMSQDEIERLTPPQKKTAFSERLTRQVTVEAVGSAAGLVPVKTFEAFDDEGNSAVGVVAAVSSRMRHMAGQIARGRPMRPDAGKAQAPIAERIAALSDADLVHEFGPRVWWDEQGYPTVVAFGQWAWSPEGLDKRKKARGYAFALDQATSDAGAHLTTFVNASTRFARVSEQGEEAEEFSLVSRDGTVSDEETAKIVDRAFRTAQVTAEVDLTGLEVLREWSGPHPDLEGHRLVGAVVSWSPAQEDKVRAELGKAPKHAPPPPAPKTRVTSGSAESRDLMDPADF